MDALHDDGERRPSLLQNHGRPSKALPEAASPKSGNDLVSKSCSPTTPALYEGCTTSGSCATCATNPSTWVPEILNPQLNSTGSCSAVDPIILSLVDPAARHFLGTGAYSHPTQEPTYVQPSYIYGAECGSAAAAAAHHSGSAGAAPFLATNLYSLDPAVLASILSMLERPPVVASNTIPHDIPNAKVVVVGDDLPSTNVFRREEGPGAGPPPLTYAKNCPHLASEPEEEADRDSVAGNATHQRQHLLTTSLGPGAYFRARKRRPYRHESFPEKLHRMLADAEIKGKGDVVCFTPSGLAFEIHRVDEFISDVIPDFFRHKSISSFRRQLSMYGFKRVKDNGPDHGAYQHELFRRDDPLLCRQMKRVTELELILPDDPTASFRN
jgi:HSF-type DNA-binding